MLDKILTFIKERGPALPVEIASAMGIDSFMAKAYLSDLIADGKLKASDKVGDSFIYFVSGQDDAAKNKAAELMSSAKSRTIATHTGKHADETPELKAKREAFAKHFGDVLARVDEPKPKAEAKPFRQPEVKPLAEPKSLQVELKATPPRPVFVPKPAPAEELVFAVPEPQNQTTAPMFAVSKEYAVPKPVSKPSMVQRVIERATAVLAPVQKEKPKPAGHDYIDMAIQNLQVNHVRIAGELIRKKGEASFLADVPSSLGAIRFLVKIRDRKKIAETDLSLAYIEGLKHNAPTLFVTSGKLSKSAEEYAEGLKGLLKIKLI